jgi:hypothetical protein
MAPAPFDTQKFVEALTASGLPEAQAKAISSAFREAADAEFSTKSDMHDLERVFKTDIRELRYELKSDMRELELRMTIKLGAMQAVGIGVIAAIVKLW